MLWPNDVKSQFIGKDPDAGKDWRQEDKGMAEDEMVGWYHRLNEHEFEQTPGDSEGQGSRVCCSPWGHRESWLSDWTTTHFTFTSCHWQLPVCSPYLWEYLFFISHKGDHTVFVFIWLISLSIVPFRSIQGIPSFPPLFMYLTMLGLCCCTQAFSSCSKWQATLRCGVEASHCCGFSGCRALALGAWALVDVARGLSSFDSWALLPWNMWDIPRLGIELVSPAFAGGFLTTESPRRAQVPCFL